MRLTSAFVLIAVSLCTLLRAAEPIAAKAAVPALVVGADKPRSFEVNAVLRLSPDHGLAIQIAWDGTLERCVLYDAADGTPLFISDGHQTLVYDLAGDRVVRVPQSRAVIRIDWKRNSEKPMSFNYRVDCKNKPENLKDSNSWIRLDQFVESSAEKIQKLEGPKGFDLFAAERQDGKVEAIRKKQNDSSTFEFTSTEPGIDYYRMILNVTGIDQKIPESSLTFPDLKKLSTEMPITEIEPKFQDVFLTMLANGGVWLPKTGVAGDDEIREMISKVIPNADWDDLRKRDLKLGAQYRAALAKQGIEFKVHNPEPVDKAAL